MQSGSIYRNSEELIEQVWRTESAIERMRGLLGHPSLQKGEAFIIAPCSSIHTVGMCYALDIIFVDQHGRVAKIYRHLAKLRIAFCFGARYTIELAAGEVDRLNVAVGDALQWSPK